MTTYAEVASRTLTMIPDHLVAQAEIPNASEGGGRQGDVIVVPAPKLVPRGTGLTIAAAGVKVVPGDPDRNSHILSGDGLFYGGHYVDEVLDYGLLVVPAGGEAVLTHTGEHGSIAFGEGVYRVFGQLDYQSHNVVDLVRD
jgi:hypothetical protein